MGWFLTYAWLIPLLPFASFAIITLTPLRANRAASGWLAIACMALATVLALGVAVEVAQGWIVTPQGVVNREIISARPPEGVFSFPAPNIVSTFRWAPAGAGIPITMGFYIDPAVAAMLLMVTITSTCIHLFSLGYMAEDPRQARFFSFIALFTAAMLLMTLSSNLLLFFMAWEIMGLCSYLLIGFWYDKDYPDPAQITPRRAAIKAFITTRIGDVLLMVGLAYLWWEAGSLDFGAAPGQIFDPEMLARLGATPTILGITAATAISLLLFAGTVGKSAQVPLHVWLPDAMEGPTPVSALIHAATMVAAGVFLVIRTFPIFEAGGALPLIAAVGACTALFAALIAVAQFDIKRILAYSTISQLGFMVAALGAGAWVAALFHLLMHAFFKALLFLGAGSVIHGMEATTGHGAAAAQDIRTMGGLRKFMPVTFWTYLIGYLALIGFPGFSGFWSKDEILADSWGHGAWLLWGVLTVTSFLTAFYMTRQLRAVFFGEFRGAPSDAHHAAHPHESPRVMTIPLIVLAIFAALGGFINLPYERFHQLAEFLQAEASEFSTLVMIISSLVALAGIVAGWWFYRGAFQSAREPDALERAAPGVFRVLERKFYIDELYAATIGRLTRWVAGAWTWFDQAVLARIVSGIGRLTQFFGQLNFIIDDTLLNDGADKLADGVNAGGDGARRIETGKIQDYVALLAIGVVILGVVYLYVLWR